jgi:hypothetical protein
MHEGLQTVFDEKIKNIIFLNGPTKERKEISELFLLNHNNIESLQFGFFLKTYAAIITNTSEEFIFENEKMDITISTENILKNIYSCVCDTTTRLNVKEIAYNKMALLHILNLFTGYSYKLEHEIPQSITLNVHLLLRQIGEVWKQIFDPYIWANLVITAINRSDKSYILLDDFRFPEEYINISEYCPHNCFSIRIISDIDKLCINKENDYHISEYALADFPFDYLLNNTIKESTINYIEPQVEAIFQIINKKYPKK